MMYNVKTVNSQLYAKMGLAQAHLNIQYNGKLVQHGQHGAHELIGFQFQLANELLHQMRIFHNNL